MNKNRITTRERGKYWFRALSKMFRVFPEKKKKMAKYLSENSEWYFDVVNKSHRFYFWRDRRRWEIDRKNIVKIGTTRSAQHAPEQAIPLRVLLFNPTALEIELHRPNISRFCLRVFRAISRWEDQKPNDARSIRKAKIDDMRNVR